KVFRVLDSFTGLGWTTNGHSGGLVPVYAVGVGAEKFASFNDNTDLPKIIMEIVNGK
ncbi:MAG: alkaline phosphatase, partial [Duncaniella dubosii]|nr:alkaline phosphatase [Duncaniella dubosii]